MDRLIAEEEHLGVTFDETTNINSDRVLNITLTTKFGAFYYHNAILPPETASAELIIKAVLETIDVVYKGKRERINAYLTDTYSIMRLIWHLLLKQSYYRDKSQFSDIRDNALNLAPSFKIARSRALFYGIL